ncbi:hypothetical protein [Chromohalobacter israelensis]|uniref:hypothetical protein n=1 Tax=Chromohalobacter israelensis TaxID=141390 RepID=UPI000FFEFC63|nr:hypothetical protein [Chromohalobacter salexigens]RXE48115.1 hypothetical protein B4O83_09060 [Chromohalobacter salexigens]
MRLLVEPLVIRAVAALVVDVGTSEGVAVMAHDGTPLVTGYVVAVYVVAVYLIAIYIAAVRVVTVGERAAASK